MIAMDPADTNFLEILPYTIDYAELRMQRDMDLSANSDYFIGGTLTAGQLRQPFALDLQVIDSITITNGTNQINLTPVSRDFLLNMYNTTTFQDQPLYFAPFNPNEVLIGPIPDQNYPVQIFATVRFDRLSATNAENYLSQQLPDLYIAACMIFLSGWMRNFGSQSDNPQMAQSWESQYQALLKSAIPEDGRRKFEASAWSSEGQPVAASPSR
jgi:hypothetical protein